MSTTRDRCLRTVRVAGEDIVSLKWSPDGSRLAFGDWVGHVGVLTPDGQELWREKRHNDIVPGLAWALDGSWVASTSWDKTVRVADARTGRERFRFDEQEAMYGFCGSPDGRLLAWGEGRGPGRVRVAEVAAGSEPRTLHETGDSVWGMAWSPDGTRLVVTLSNAHVLILDAATGARLHHWSWNHGEGVCWSPDSRMVGLTASRGGVDCFDAATAQRAFACGAALEGKLTVAWSACGRVIAAGGNDSLIHLWSAPGGDNLVTLAGHTATVRTLAFSTVGGLLASGSRDDTIRLWDVADLVGPPLSAPPREGAEEDYLRRQALSVGRRPRRLAAAPAWVPRLEGADEAVGCLGVIPPGGRYPALSPDGRSLYAVTAESTRCWALDAGPAAVERWHIAEGSEAWQLAVSPDGARLAIAAQQGPVRLRDARTGALLWEGTKYGGPAAAVAWAPDGTRLASGYWSYDVPIWDGASGSELLTLKGHTGGIIGLNWSPDGRWLATTSNDGSIRIWDGRTGECVQTVCQGQGSLWDIAWSPDGRWLASCGTTDKAVILWDAVTRTEVRRLTGHTGTVFRIAWSADSRLLASAAADRRVRVWSPEAGELARFEEAHPEWAFGVAWGPGGAFLASAGRNGVRLWDTRALSPPAAAAPPSGERGEVPAALRPLPAALARLGRAGQPAPLGLLRGLLELTGGAAPAGPLAGLARHPGAAALAALRWPAEARLGLAALLLRRCDFPAEWAAPEGLPPARLRTELARALADADDAPPGHYPAPLPPLEEALREVDGRLLALLHLVGPQAVAADPGLPLRLLPHARVLPPQAARARRLPLALGDAGAAAAAASPWGVGRSGLATRGSWRSLLAWQLTLPDDALAARQRRGELLYRAGAAREGGAAGPLVLLLDVSPASYGPVEAVTRACAGACAREWQARGEAVWLVTAGGAGQARELRAAADLPAVWAARSGRPARAAEALRVAGRVLAGLGGAGRGSVLLLAPATFGWGEEAPEGAAVRGLFVQPRGRRGAPAWAGACRRWAQAPAGEAAAALQALREVLS